ncbi:MAG: hypothetical protein JWO02_2049, partial [Solirubrobacterales bacterium]|nr:hypothetical protein [Solirubrobacterales bacterium]
MASRSGWRGRGQRVGIMALMGMASTALMTTTAIAAPAQQDIVDRDNSGAVGKVGLTIAISHDGRYVLLAGSDLCCTDANHVGDAYLRDRVAGTTTLVSDGDHGQIGNSVAFPTDLTPDARFVVFDSNATNLSPADGNFITTDVFVRDRQAGTLDLVSVDSAGQQSSNRNALAGSISDDGRFVVFNSPAVLDPTTHPGKSGVYLRDRRLSTTNWIGDGAAQRGPAAISGDGRYVAFTNAGQAYVKDMGGGATELISKAPTGDPGDGATASTTISPDGRYVVYSTRASNLVPGAGGVHSDVLRYDRQTGITDRVSVPVLDCGAGGRGDNGAPQVSAGGNLVTWSGTGADLVVNDTNNAGDVFVRDMGAGRTFRVDVSPTGEQGNGTTNGAGPLSGDGNWVGYTSNSSNLVADDTNSLAYDAFVRNPPSSPDAPAPAPATLSIDDQTVDPEGDPPATTAAPFTVSLSRAVCDGPVTVSVRALDATAVAGEDYEPTKTTITFQPGETSKVVDVPIIGDTRHEADETFVVDLGTPTNATIADDTGLGTIIDDDAARPPVATTDAATGVTTTTATVNGTVNPNGTTAAYHFE